ncbi:GNAT family N-acetyltransferase [Vallitalea okinawensis]|uniref:GNAT family N-acetyltransferase n=1 Tax=Vallitalea okinawensis TaxID=2078660 RepID=UPI000CFD0D5E|nr:GNAT family N-acetyltransferase [Vallitalea okinawensis]
MLNIRQLGNEDFGAFLDVTRNAYTRMAVNTPEEREKRIEKFKKAHRECGYKNFFGAFDDNYLLGGMILYDFNMQLLSTKAKAGGVGAVAVDLLHKKEKVAKQLIEYFIQHYKMRGTYMLMLYPFRPDFYKKMGFGYGTKMNQYRIKPENLPVGDSKGSLYFLKQEDQQLLFDCYQRFVDQNHGMIERSIGDFDNIFENSENRVVAYKKEGSVLAYISFTFQPYEEGSFLSNDMVIKEFIYEDRKGLYELLTFLHSQKDQIRYIIVNTQDEYFHHLLSDPRNGVDHVIPHVYHESNIQGVGLMYRVIDVKGIFKALSQHNFGDVTCRLKITIRDSFYKENEGSTIIHFINGLAHYEASDFEVEITLDVSEFSSMIMGAISFKALYRYGLVDISDVSYIDTVHRIFRTDEKPKCTTGF